MQTIVKETNKETIYITLCVTNLPDILNSSTGGVFKGPIEEKTAGGEFFQRR